jgi:hypothetical protein
MERISIVEEWKASARREGELHASRNILLRQLPRRYRTEVPDDLKQRIQQTTDTEVLARWIDAVVTQPSLEAFRAVVEGRASPGSGT